MKTKTMNVWMGILVFLSGFAFVGEYNPFLLPLFISTYLQGANILIMLTAGLAGLLAAMKLVCLFRYGSILLLVTFLLFSRDHAFLTAHRNVWAALAALADFLVNITYIIFFHGELDMLLVLSEAVLIFCLAMIYGRALYVIQFDFAKIAVDSRDAISVLALSASVFYGLPLDIAGIFRVAEAVGIYLLLYVIYRFGIGTGSAWAAAAGMILSVKTGEMQYLTVMLAMAAVCSAAAAIVPYKKIGIVLGVLLVGMISSVSYFPYLISENGIKALVSSTIVFLLTPVSLMTYLDERVRRGEIYESSSEWGRLMMDRVADFARAFRRMEYTVEGADGVGITFSEIGNVLEDFSSEFENVVPMKKTMEAAIISELTRKNAVVKSMVLIRNKAEHYEIYLSIKMKQGRLLTAAEVREILENHGNMTLQTMDVSRNIVSKDFSLLAFEERPPFYVDMAVKKLSKYDSGTSGDNYMFDELKGGQNLMILSDGMGSGEKASAQSSFLINTLEDMLSAGFDKELSIKFINSYLSRRNKGEIFATLDMLLIDCYTGYGRLYKQGAAATYVKRGDWIEVIKSTSLPVGIEEEAVCEKSMKKFYENDIIIMISDGVMESIVFENREDYMKEIIQNSESIFAEEIADDIITGIRNLNGKNLKDDATVLVGVVRRY